MKKVIIPVLLLAACAVSAAAPFELGIARYTFRSYKLDDALKLLQDIDCHQMGLIENTIARDASDAEIKAYKEKLSKYGVELVTAGPLYCSDEKEIRELFEFAKRYGLKSVSVVPYELHPKIAAAKTEAERAKAMKEVPARSHRIESDRAMDIVEKYVKLYDIKAAVHNHGPDNEFLYPTGDSSLKRIGSRDRRIGVCLDVGHHRRSGSDPVEFIRKHGDRIFEVHLKNIIIDPVKNLAMPGPRGELDIPSIIQALTDIGFTGPCLIEYEKDFDNNQLALAESVGYYRGIMKMVKSKYTPSPVPEGANTLSAEEKAEGFKLLFDGKKLPVENWVGVKSEWNFKEFPRRGWYVKDGALSMRPMSMITNGKWVPLPEEDRKLAGGGDIVTVKKYKDFIFKFDFRLTEAANSGVKYFYNEGLNNNSCPEYQVLDPAHPDFHCPNPGGVPNVHRIAALYDLIATPLADKAIKPLGQWNHGMIVSKGRKVEHYLNGVKVLEYERGSKAFRDAVKLSKYLDWQDKGQFWGEAETGRLLLQDHSDSVVSYCNLKIKEL